MMRKYLFFIVIMCLSDIFSQSIWQPLPSNGIFSASISSFTPIYSNAILAGTGVGSSFVSSDNGQNWTNYGNGLTESFKFSTISRSGIIYATAPSGVYKSSNNGTSWTKVQNNSVYSFNQIAVTPNGTIFVAAIGSNYCILKSTDQGNTFTVSRTDLAQHTALQVDSSGTVFAGLYSSGIYKGIWGSIDNGNTWFELSLGLTDKNVTSIACFQSSKYLATTADGAYISQNHGYSWTKINTGLTDIGFINSYFSPDGTGFAFTESNIYRLNPDQNSWSLITYGLEGYSIKCLISLNNYLFLGTNYGVYKSSNNGSVWSLCNNGFNDFYIRNVVADSLGNIFACLNPGIFRSTDGGQNWTSCNSGLINQTVKKAVLKNSNFYLITNFGLYIFDNIGNNWRRLRNSSDITSMEVLTNGTILTAGSGRIYRSTNQGVTWTSVYYSSGVSITQLKQVRNGKIYAVISGKLGASSDNGNTWSLLSPQIRPDPAVIPSVYSISETQHGALLINSNKAVYLSTSPESNWHTIGPTYLANDLLVDSKNNVFAQTYPGIGISRNLGYSWNSYSGGNANIGKAVSLGFYAEDRLICCYRASIYTTINKTTNQDEFPENSWQLLGPYKVLDKIAVGPSKTLFGIEYGSNTLRSTDNGESWTEVLNHNLSGNTYSVTIDSSGVVYIGCSNGIYISRNNGNTWTLSNSGLFTLTVTNVFSYSRNIIFAATGTQIYRSTDSGNSWTIVYVLPRSLNTGYFFASNGIVFAAPSGGGVYKSTDFGNSWNQIQVGLGTSNRARHPATNSTGIILLADHDKGLLRSTDNGLTWTRPQSALGNIFLSGLAFKDNNIAMAGTADGVYTSSDAGISWVKLNNNLTGRQVFDLVPDIYSHNHVFGIVKLTMQSYTDAPFTVCRTVHYPTMPEIPVLISPSNNSNGISVPTSFVWKSSAYSNSYNLQIAIDEGFTNIIVNDTALVDTSRIVNTLQNGMNYYWRVRAKNFDGSSQFSTIFTFRTIIPPVSPILATPTNNSVNQSVNGLTFRWIKATEGIESIQKYQFQVSTDSLFGSVFVNDSTLTDTSKVVNGMSFITKYYWRVRAKNQAGWGSWSAIWNTTTAIEKPTTPVLDSPANNSNALLQPVTLKWNKSLRVEKYTLEVSDVSNFATLILSDSTMVDTIKVLPHLASPKTFYWRVKSRNTGGISDYSSVWNFRTLGTPSVVTLLVPLNNAQFIPITDAVFKWTSAKDRTESIQNYRFELKIDTSQSNYIILDTLLTDTVKIISGLSHKTTYFWRVGAKNEVGWGNFTTWNKFTTILKPINSPVGLVALPESVGQIKLNWTDNSDNELGFIVYRKVGDSTSTSDLVVIDSVGMNNTEFIDSTVADTTLYSYLIRAYNNDTLSAQSNFATVVTLTNIMEISWGVPKEFILFQNFPNPFNPSTLIRLGIPKDSYVEIELYSVEGEFIHRLLQDDKSAGYYEVKLELPTLSSGIYLYRIKAIEHDSRKTFTSSRKLILMK